MHGDALRNELFFFIIFMFPVCIKKKNSEFITYLNLIYYFKIVHCRILNII